MPLRISKTVHQYAGRIVQAGEEFDVEQRFVPVLLALGRIVPEEGELGYIRRDMTAATPAAYPTKVSVGKRKHAKVA